MDAKLETIREFLSKVDLSVLGHYEKKDYAKLMKYVNKEAPYIIEFIEDEIVLDVIFECFVSDYEKLVIAYAELAEFHSKNG